MTSKAQARIERSDYGSWAVVPAQVTAALDAVLAAVVRSVADGNDAVAIKVDDHIIATVIATTRYTSDEVGEALK